MNSQQKYGQNGRKCRYVLECDKGQTKHLSSLWRTTRLSRWMTPTLTTVLIRPFLNLFSANALQLMFSGLCRSHSILLNVCLTKLNDNFDILFQTRVKMYLVPSLNSSTMTMCRLCALIFALSKSGMGTGGWDIAWYCHCCLSYLTWRDLPPM